MFSILQKIIVFLVLASPAFGTTFIIPASKLEHANPIDPTDTASCFRGSPFFQCCEADGSPCEVPVRECDPNGSSCTNGSFPTCYEKALSTVWETTDLKMTKWVCNSDFSEEPESTHSRWLFASVFIPKTQGTGLVGSCKVIFNSDMTAGNAVFRLAGLAVNDDGSTFVPTLIATESETVSVAHQGTANRANATGFTANFCIEDSNTGACCTGANCDNKWTKIFVALDDASTDSAPDEEVKIEFLICKLG